MRKRSNPAAAGVSGPTRRALLRGGAAGLLASGGLAKSALARSPGTYVFSRPTGLLYLPSIVMERYRLVEKHAARLGMRNVSISWIKLPAFGRQQEALVRGEIDLVCGGFAPMLKAWVETGGKVKGIIGSSAQPLSLICTDPRIKSLADIGPDDRIAVPILKHSTQVMLLQMAAMKLYGPDQWARFDSNCVAMGHPEALVMLRNRDSAIRLHFAVPPYCHYALQRIPGARKISGSREILGGLYTSALFFVTTAFAEANPALVEAVYEAVLEARSLIQRNLFEVVQAYRELSGDKQEVAEVLKVLAAPDMMAWLPEPQNTFVFAQHLHATGRLPKLPSSWRAFFLPTAHGLVGS